jgi:hypothetical protein
MGSEPEPVAEPLVIVSPGTESVSICTEQGNDLAVHAEDGTRIDSPLDGNGCWSDNVAAGNYIVKATNPQCSGASTTQTFIVAAQPAPPAPVVVEPVETIVPYIAFFGGRESVERPDITGTSTHQDSSNAFGIKIGALSRLTDKYWLFGQIGLYTLTSLNDDTDWSDDGVFFDLGFEMKLTERGFMGIGMGLWNVDNRDSLYDDVSYLMYGGGDINDTGTQWFIEGRFFKDALTKNSDNNMFTMGIRQLFR